MGTRYKDIMIAEKYIQQLKDRIEKSDTYDSLMREDSVRRYKKIYEDLIQMANTTAEIIKRHGFGVSEMLVCSIPSKKNHTKSIKQNQAEELPSVSNPTPVPKLPRLTAETPTEPSHVVTEGSEEPKQTPSHPEVDKRKLIRDFGTTLGKLSNEDLGYYAVNELISIIYNWFNARISTRYESFGIPSFNYRAEKIKDIIYAYVVLYGYHLEKVTTQSFVTENNAWIASLSVNRNSCKWYAPMSVREIFKEIHEKHRIPPEYANLASVVLWDILMDSELSELCKDPKTHYLSTNALYDVNINNLREFFQIVFHCLSLQNSLSYYSNLVKTHKKIFFVENFLQTLTVKYSNFTND